VFNELVRAGVSVRSAKTAVDRLKEGRSAVLTASRVDNYETLKKRIEAQKIGVHRLAEPEPDIDVKAVRERLQLTQAEFAGLLRIKLDTLQNWEQRRTKPDPAAATLLSMIQRDPGKAMELLIEE
jgi:DNA-binding transcriptional regulator YiaG